MAELSHFQIHDYEVIIHNPIYPKTLQASLTFIISDLGLSNKEGLEIDHDVNPENNTNEVEE
jgi:hypothetical protein